MSMLPGMPTPGKANDTSSAAPTLAVQGLVNRGAVQHNESRIGRMMIVLGPANMGKTYAALTFPNPTVLNFDDKIPVPHPSRPNGTPVIPFNNNDFCDSLFKRTNPNIIYPNKRDALLTWVGQFISTFKSDETLIIDSLGRIEDWWRTQTVLVEGHKETSPTGGGIAWNMKINYFATLFSLLQSCPGTVYITAHTQPEYTKQGSLTGRVKPLFSGQFAEKVCTYCTDVFRAYNRITDAGVRYYWRIKPDAIFDCSTAIPTSTTDIPAGYEHFKRLIDDPTYDPMKSEPRAPTNQFPMS